MWAVEGVRKFRFFEKLSDLARAVLSSIYSETKGSLSHSFDNLAQFCLRTYFSLIPWGLFNVFFLSTLLPVLGSNELLRTLGRSCEKIRDDCELIVAVCFKKVSKVLLQ